MGQLRVKKTVKCEDPVSRDPLLRAETTTVTESQTEAAYRQRRNCSSDQMAHKIKIFESVLFQKNFAAFLL